MSVRVHHLSFRPYEILAALPVERATKEAEPHMGATPDAMGARMWQDRVSALTHRFSSTSSTRRLRCRPAGSSEPSGFELGATGRLAPYPAVTIPTDVKCSLCASQMRTALARRSERRWL